jgi:ATP-dependent Clp protease ATP-binding subunit ClpC
MLFVNEIERQVFTCNDIVTVCKQILIIFLHGLTPFLVESSHRNRRKIMAGMERFTQRARRVLSLAHQEAERSRNNNIGTEHLLLGLMDEEGGVAGRVLRELGMTSDRVREVIRRVTTSSSSFDPNRVELAAETQQVLEHAVEEARRLGHHYIGTEHILLGLIRVDSTAMEVLRDSA